MEKHNKKITIQIEENLISTPNLLTTFDKLGGNPVTKRGKSPFYKKKELFRFGKIKPFEMIAFVELHFAR